MAKIKKQEALDYHSQKKPGKIEVVPTKPTSTQRDLSLAYSPGVAEPCIAIDENKEDVYKYTAKGNLVAVISNGTAVLGLGDIGPEASKPVMEGKGVLFKIFADIDVFDIEVDATDPEKFIETVKAIAPTFGGINLEDIKAPEAFVIEERLREELDIPVMHDDQHGTAIISGAALLNASEIAGKEIKDLKIVISGAGASAMACARLYLGLGAQKKNIVMLDSKGVIYKGRKGLDKHKSFFATSRKERKLDEAMKGADMLLGLSTGGIVTRDMVRSMAPNPIVFALANPDPEISYKDATEAREDVIMATGRSDNPNQVNNVLGFPFIFRGALDVRATAINEEMKVAAVRAIAELAKETVPEEVAEAYGEKHLEFGRESIIPKPLDPRLITFVAPAVAKAAMESGVAREPIEDWDKYRDELNRRLGLENKLIRNVSQKAKENPKKVVFAEADNYKVLKAAHIAREEEVAEPVLLGPVRKIKDMIREFNLDLEDIQIIDPRSSAMTKKRAEFAQILFEKRKRKGYTEYEAEQRMRERNWFGTMMVETGEADAFISGITRNYADVIRPGLQIVGVRDDVKKIAGMYIMLTKRGPMFFADTTVNVNPTAEELVEITLQMARAIRRMKITPRIALLSYSNFGSATGEIPKKVAKAVDILHRDHPNLIVDGDVQANFALNNELMDEKFPFSTLANRKTNGLVFPDLASGNITYKLIQEMTGGEAIGPIVLGLKKSCHVLQLGSSVREIVNMIKLAVIDAQTNR